MSNYDWYNDESWYAPMAPAEEKPQPKPAGKGGQKPSGGRRRGPKKPPAQGTSIEISNE